MSDLKLLATQALADRAEHTSQSGTVWRDEHYERAVFEREPALARGYLEAAVERDAARESLRQLHNIMAEYERLLLTLDPESYHARMIEAVKERDAARAALKEACEIVVDVCLHGTSPGLRATIAALRTRGGV